MYNCMETILLCRCAGPGQSVVVFHVSLFSLVLDLLLLLVQISDLQSGEQNQGKRGHALFTLSRSLIAFRYVSIPVSVSHSVQLALLLALC